MDRGELLLSDWWSDCFECWQIREGIRHGFNGIVNCKAKQLSFGQSRNKQCTRFCEVIRSFLDCYVEYSFSILRICRTLEVCPVAKGSRCSRFETRRYVRE